MKEAETSNSLLLLPELLFASSTGVENPENNSMELDSDTSLDKSNNSLNKSADSDEGMFS